MAAVRADPPEFPSRAACAAKQEAFYDLDGKAGLVLVFAVFLPLLAGLPLGVPLVARELESGTASLAWTLSRSRGAGSSAGRSRSA